MDPDSDIKAMIDAALGLPGHAGVSPAAARALAALGDLRRARLGL